MKKVYEYQNGIICVTLPESFNLDYLKDATSDFLKKVISEEIKNGDSDKSRNF